MPSIEPEQHVVAEQFIHVAAGVVVNERGEILIAQRPQHLHQGGLWEFPGGKVETGEDAFAALQRELREELNIEIDSAESLIRIPWQYTDKSILLHVYRVQNYSGVAEGMEGQPIQWVKLQDLAHYDFPAANQGILQAIRLPASYMITGQFKDFEDFKRRLESGLKQGVRLVQFRAKQLLDSELEIHVECAKQLCAQYEADLLLNSRPELAERYALGVHLNSQQLMACQERPLRRALSVAASVHNETELEQANRIGVDFIVISPVQATSSHPHAIPLGWDKFKQLVEKSSIPAYALGGMSVNDIDTAKSMGAQGVAAISRLWG